MTAKEQAVELIMIYFPLCTYGSDGTVMPIAKQAAILFVNEMLIETKENYDSLHSIDRFNFWRNVKKEIIKFK